MKDLTSLGSLQALCPVPPGNGPRPFDPHKSSTLTALPELRPDTTRKELSCHLGTQIVKNVFTLQMFRQKESRQVCASYLHKLIG